MDDILLIITIPILILAVLFGPHLKYKQRKLFEEVFPKWGRRISIGLALVGLIVLLLLELFEVI